MLSEQSMVKVRWLALASTLAFFAIMNVRQMRGLLVLVAVGVLYNLMLSSSRNDDLADHLRGLSVVVDLVGLGLLIYYTGGLRSIFIVFLAINIFSIAARVGVGSGVTIGFLAAAASSFYYFNNPTAANQTLVLTSAVVFVAAPIGARLLGLSPGQRGEVLGEVAPGEVVGEIAASPEERAPRNDVPIQDQERDTSSRGSDSSSEPRGSSQETTPVEVAPREVASREVASAEEPPRNDVKAPSETDITKRGLADTLAVDISKNEHHEELRPEDARALKQKVNELALLHEASKALGATLVLAEVVDTIVDIAAKGMVADIAGALIFDVKTGLLTVAGLRGFSSEEREVINSTTFAPGENLLGESFSKKKTFNITDLSEERPGWSPFNGRIKSFLVTPLATEGYEIGVLFLGRYVREPFTESSEGFLETMAAQAAIAVENANLYSQAQELAIHDGLTGTYNYRYFMKQLEEELKRAERYGRPLALAMIDIDLFKNVNDTYGHQRGDDVLRGLTQTLTSTTRETDIVARYGGEEFVVILPETEIEDAMEVAEKLRTAVANASYARENGHSIKITISLGVATYPSLAGNQEELLRRADDALYSAKIKRNMVVSAGSEKRSLS